MRQFRLFLLSFLLIALNNCEGLRIPGEEEQVPEVALSDELKGDNSHWCCAGITPITTTVLTQLSSQTQLYAEPIKVGYTDCGLFGWSSCTVWAYQYKIIVRYFISTTESLDYSSCPPAQVKCCKDYIFLPSANNCIALSTLTPDVIATLQQLAINQGR